MRVAVVTSSGYIYEVERLEIEATRVALHSPDQQVASKSARLKLLCT